MSHPPGDPSPTRPKAGPAFVRIRSYFSVAETVRRLEATARQRGLTLFARIDHALSASAAGLEMRPTQLIILGTPRNSARLILETPTLGLDLPLRVLVFEDGDGKVWACYEEPEHLLFRHGAPLTLATQIAGIASLVTDAAVAVGPYAPS